MGRENRTGEAWQHMHLAPQVSAYGPDLHQLLGATDYIHQPDGFTQAKSKTAPSVARGRPNRSHESASVSFSDEKHVRI